MLMLAQAPDVVVINQAAPPWWNIAAVVVVALIGWYVIHRTSKSRDFENWRRTTLTTAAAAIIENSFARWELVNQQQFHKLTFNAVDLAQARKHARAIDTNLRLLELVSEPRSEELAAEIYMHHLDSAIALDELVKSYTTMDETEVTQTRDKADMKYDKLLDDLTYFISAVQKAVGIEPKIKKDKQTT